MNKNKLEPLPDMLYQLSIAIELHPNDHQTELENIKQNLHNAFEQFSKYSKTWHISFEVNQVEIRKPKWSNELRKYIFDIPLSIKYQTQELHLEKLPKEVGLLIESFCKTYLLIHDCKKHPEYCDNQTFEHLHQKQETPQADVQKVSSCAKSFQMFSTKQKLPQDQHTRFYMITKRLLETLNRCQPASHVKAI